LILDTNALSAYLDSTPKAVEIVSGARELAIPVIVAGEFAFGIALSRHREAYEKSLQRMLDRCTVLDIGIETARHYAAIRAYSERCRSAFRGDGDHDSELMPITIPS
jgi:predicted nucleic acid-binding protein